MTFSNASAFWLRNLLDCNVSPNTLLNAENTISTSHRKLLSEVTVHYSNS